MNKWMDSPGLDFCLVTKLLCLLAGFAFADTLSEGDLRVSCMFKHSFVFESVLMVSGVLQQRLPYVRSNSCRWRASQMLRWPGRRSDRGLWLRRDTPSSGKRGETLATFPQSFSHLSWCRFLFSVPYLSGAILLTCSLLSFSLVSFSKSRLLSSGVFPLKPLHLACSFHTPLHCPISSDANLIQPEMILDDVAFLHHLLMHSMTKCPKILPRRQQRLCLIRVCQWMQLISTAQGDSVVSF